MKTLISTTALAVAIVGASGAAFSDTDADPVTMTCADFAGLELADQEIAVAAIEATKMEMAEGGLVDETGDAEPEVDAEADTGTEEDTGETAETAEPVEGETETEMADDTAEPSPVVEELLIACDGNDDVLAIDAFGS